MNSKRRTYTLEALSIYGYEAHCHDETMMNIFKKTVQIFYVFPCHLSILRKHVNKAFCVETLPPRVIKTVTLKLQKCRNILAKNVIPSERCPSKAVSLARLKYKPDSCIVIAYNTPSLEMGERGLTVMSDGGNVQSMRSHARRHGRSHVTCRCYDMEGMQLRAWELRPGHYSKTPISPNRRVRQVYHQTGVK